MIKKGKDNGMNRLIFSCCTVFILLALSSSTFAQQCPTGSYLWVDNWGNRICKGFDTGGTTTTEGSLKNCPTGTYSWVDEWGNRVCKAFQSGQNFYDTSKGCPVGTYQWVANWGNKVCKKF
jgi:hypothetical protein